ncbi:MAG: HAMP domain-containing histidine kinase [Caulobacteraceae bacterium]|nr:HAMP domain-containing histidine kinase [Caulobacteraceae bacterium]
MSRLRDWLGRAAAPPLTIQIIALLVGGLLIGQAVTLAVVLFTPPPRPPVYHVGEIVAALQGGPLHVRDGPPLRRRVSAGPPPADRGFQEHERLVRAELARRLNVDEAAVRLFVERPPWFARRPRPWFRREWARDERFLGPPAPGSAPGPEAAVRRFGRRDHLEAVRPIVGDFIAAVRDPSGLWLTVESTAEPFPNEWQLRVILWFVACLLLLAPAGYVFAHRLTASLRRFAGAAERLGRDPTAPALTLRGPAEIGAAAAAFNQMQVRLRRYIDDRTNMIGAISHDLRTPLTRVRFKLERAPASLRAAVLSDLDQMESMIDEVLAFVRDASRPGERAPLDLLSVLEYVVEETRLTGADIEVAAEVDSLVVEADSLALQRLFSNLIDNAVKYGDRAWVSLSREDGSAVVRVVDGGGGLPDHELDRVFDPFYRVERSRSRETGGMGLGLAVARSIARAHGGDVALANGEAGLVATVRLPLPGGEAGAAEAA